MPNPEYLDIKVLYQREAGRYALFLGARSSKYFEFIDPESFGIFSE
jgi:hypothetical protein